MSAFTMLTNIVAIYNKISMEIVGVRHRDLYVAEHRKLILHIK